jgi:hypothetical protein
MITRTQPVRQNGGLPIQRILDAHDKIEILITPTYDRFAT